MKKRNCLWWIATLVSIGLLHRPSAAQLLRTDYTNQPMAVMKNGNNFGTTQDRFNRYQTFTVGTGANAKSYLLSLMPVQFINRVGAPQAIRTPTAGGPNQNSVNYMGVLNGFRSGAWTFNYTDARQQDLTLSNGSLVIKTYSTFVDPANGINASMVGADLYVSYNPTAGTNDPPKNNNLHWIQVVYDNWDTAPGTTENVLDATGGFDPYYDNAGAANQDFFWDQPSRSTNTPTSMLNSYDFSRGPIFWTAELFLAQEVGRRQRPADAGTVNIYDGIRWGWQVTLVPEPGTTAFGVAVLCGGGAYLLRRRRCP
jgi:hypothetical protein